MDAQLNFATLRNRCLPVLLEVGRLGTRVAAAAVVVVAAVGGGAAAVAGFLLDGDDGGLGLPRRLPRLYDVHRNLVALLLLLFRGVPFCRLLLVLLSLPVLLFLLVGTGGIRQLDFVIHRDQRYSSSYTGGGGANPLRIQSTES